MATSFGSLAKELRATAARLPDAVNELKITVASTISTDLVRSTLVDTGEAMSNWIVSSPDAVTIPRPAFAPSPRGYMAQNTGQRHWSHRVDPSITRQANEGPALDAATEALSGVRPGDPIHITNSVPHIDFLDNGTDTIDPANFALRATTLAEGIISRSKLLE